MSKDDEKNIKKHQSKLRKTVKDRKGVRNHTKRKWED